jgi:phosphatidylglycerol:prolipoprotein diacylglycerol transferase
MSPLGPYIHNIDPIIGTIFGVHLWWYGLSYTLGFFNAFNFINKRREKLSLAGSQVYDLCILIAVGVLIGGRIGRGHLLRVAVLQRTDSSDPCGLARWNGESRTSDRRPRRCRDILSYHRTSVPDDDGCNGCTRRRSFSVSDGSGNFIDGQILGSVTDVPWAVKFPDADGFRHPVVLYDGIKNLLIIPILLLSGRRNPPHGFVTGLFLFLYSFLRIPVDLFREYPTSLLGLATGQTLNISLSVIGLAVMTVVCGLPGEREKESCEQPFARANISWRKPLFIAILAFCLIMPSDWTQDVPDRYGKRHPGLRHTALYPHIPADTATE